MPIPAILYGVAAAAFRLAASPTGLRVMGFAAESAPSAGASLANGAGLVTAGAGAVGSMIAGPAEAQTERKFCPVPRP